MTIHEKKSITVGFITVEVKEDENGNIGLRLTSQGRGKLGAAKLGKVPLPLKLSIKEGTTLSFTVMKG